MARRLLETTLILIGNDEYVKQNRSYGLTTLRSRQVNIEGGRLRFSFKGKSGRSWKLQVADRRIARVVRECQDLPGQELFRYVDADDTVRGIDSGDFNQYLREITGREVTAKDFRIWAGTVLAALSLLEFEQCGTQAAAKRNVTRAIQQVAARLGNTPAICRKCYVHLVEVDKYLGGGLTLQIEAKAASDLRGDLTDLQPEETAVLALLVDGLERGKQA